MKQKIFLAIACLSFIFSIKIHAQNIYNFTSVAPSVQIPDFRLPTTHTFQYIMETDVPLAAGGVMPERNDFTGYVPIGGSSTNGYLSVNSEALPIGGVTIMDIQYNVSTKLWERSNSEVVDFSAVSYTQANCSGTVTPWGTIVSCEERVLSDANGDGFNDIGWAIEIDPATRTVIDQPGDLAGGDKLWALGNFAHENVAVHPNQRTVYQGVDASTGYIFKFVANTAADLSSGDLYVYTGPKNGNGSWAFVSCWPCANNPNATLTQAAALGATVFAGVEDVEYDPISGYVYAAVKNEHTVYRFQDNSPLTGGTVSNFSTYVGGSTTMMYNITHSGGTTAEAWGTGNDNLAFDNAGNLWVYQDGSKNYIWVVDAGHTQANPKVRIFGQAPAGGESTGITFSPDNKFLFMSIQHPSASNSSTSQLDANGDRRFFDKHVTIVVALKNNLGNGGLCKVNDNLNIGHSSGIFQVSNIITSTSLVANNIHVNYHAGNCIEMNAGFQVDLGGEFLADIVPCDMSLKGEERSDK